MPWAEEKHLAPTYDVAHRANGRAFSLRRYRSPDKAWSSARRQCRTDDPACDNSRSRPGQCGRRAGQSSRLDHGYASKKLADGRKTLRQVPDTSKACALRLVVSSAFSKSGNSKTMVRHLRRRCLDSQMCVPHLHKVSRQMTHGSFRPRNWPLWFVFAFRQHKRFFCPRLP